jgi:hypothetical protein
MPNVFAVPGKSSFAWSIAHDRPPLQQYVVVDWKQHPNLQSTDQVNADDTNANLIPQSSSSASENVSKPA